MRVGVVACRITRSGWSVVHRFHCAGDAEAVWLVGALEKERYVCTVLPELVQASGTFARPVAETGS